MLRNNGQFHAFEKIDNEQMNNSAPFALVSMSDCNVSFKLLRNKTSHRYSEQVLTRGFAALFAFSIKQRNLVSKPVLNIGEMLYSWLQKPLCVNAA